MVRRPKPPLQERALRIVKPGSKPFAVQSSGMSINSMPSIGLPIVVRRFRKTTDLIRERIISIHGSKLMAAHSQSFYDGHFVNMTVHLRVGQNWVYPTDKNEFADRSLKFRKSLRTAVSTILLEGFLKPLPNQDSSCG